MINVITLFCDSVRQEVEKSHSIIGVFPDNINIDASNQVNVDSGNSNIAHIFPRLTAYTRINFSANSPPSESAHVDVYYNDTQLSTFTIENAQVLLAVQESVKRNEEICGLLVKMEMQNFPISENGKLKFVYVDGSQSFISGYLNINILR